MQRQLAQHLRSWKPKGHPPTPIGTWGHFGETRGGVGKSGVLEHKSSNISETRKDRGKVTVEQRSFEENSNGTNADPLRPPLPKVMASQPPILQSLLSQERIKLGTSNSWGPSEQKSIKILEKRERGRIHGLPNFLITPYYLRNG